MTKSIQLVETVAKRIRLNAAQLAALEDVSRELAGKSDWWRNSSLDAAESRPIRIEARGESHYDVTVLDAIGAIGIPDLVIRVVPKIPFGHFAFIAEHAIGSAPRTHNSQISLSTGSNFLELMACWYLDELDGLLRYGLTRDYQEVEEWGESVRGSIAVIPTVGRWLTGKAETLAIFEEFDFDSPLNRILKAVCNVLSKAPDLDAHTRGRASRAFRRLPNVGALEQNDIRTDVARSTERYRDAIELGVELLRGTLRGLDSGESRSHTFLIKTPLFIERGLRNIVASGLSPVLVAQGGMTLLPSSVRVHPDLLLGNRSVTGDIKYKVASGYWDRGDLAQAVFFAAAYQVTRGFILTFGDNSSADLAALDVGDVRIARIQWDLSSSSVPEASAGRIVREISALYDDLVQSASAHDY